MDKKYRWQLRQYAVDDRGCWVWEMLKSPSGYGVLTQNRRKLYAHRVFYEYYIEVIPEGLCVLHRCDNPSCVNPDHLFVGTYQDNMDDMVAKGRQNKPKGEASGMSKLTNYQVLAIRKDTRSTSKIAKDYGVTANTIRDIKTRITWKHI